MKDGVKQEILTNYYLNKYDKYAPNSSNEKYYSTLNRSSNKRRESNSQRKNFKQVFMEKHKKPHLKTEQSNEFNESIIRKKGEKKKNFKNEIESRKN